MPWVCMTTYERPEYLRRSLNSFLRTKFPDNIHVVVSDDCSQDPRVREVLEQFRHARPGWAECRIMYRERRVGCDPNMIGVMRYALAATPKDKWVVTTDSDVIYNPRWLHVLFDTWHGLRAEQRENAALLSCFDAESVSDHRVIAEHVGVNEKNHCGGFAAIVPRYVLEHPRFAVEQWDWGLTNLARTHKPPLRFYCTPRSWVEHLGPGKSGLWDRARNFVGEEEC